MLDYFKTWSDVLRIRPNYERHMYQPICLYLIRCGLAFSGLFQKTFNLGDILTQALPKTKLNPKFQNVSYIILSWQNFLRL